MAPRINHAPASQHALLERAFGMSFVQDGDFLESTEGTTAEQRDILAFLEYRRSLQASMMPAGQSTGGSGFPISIRMIHSERLEAAVAELHSAEQDTMLDQAREALSTLTGVDWKRNKAAVTCDVPYQEQGRENSRFVMVMRDLNDLSQHGHVNYEFLGDRIRVTQLSPEVIQAARMLPPVLGFALPEPVKPSGNRSKLGLPSPNQRGLRVTIENLVMG